MPVLPLPSPLMANARALGRARGLCRGAARRMRCPGFDQISGGSLFLRVQDTALDEPEVRGSFALCPSLGISKRL
jgi:hypothetical protein